MGLAAFLLGAPAAHAATTAHRPAARAVPAAATAATQSPLPWIADDWPRAVSVAKARKLPIFVENWAPW